MASVKTYDVRTHGCQMNVHDSERFVGLDHVAVVRGRDYTDVQPFKGVYSGAADSTLTVEVSFTRLR